MKTCTGCKQILPLSEYHQQSPGKLKARCKKCVCHYNKERQSKIYKADPEKEKYRKRTEYKNSEMLRCRKTNYAKIWNKKNKSNFLASLKKYYCNNKHIFKANTHKRRARIAGNGGEFTAYEWLELKSLYNHMCLRCGDAEPQIELTPDHVMPISKGGTSNIDNIQPLCLSCNKIKYNKCTDYRPSIEVS